MLKSLFNKYKRFEKCFFKEDKEKDLIAYVKLKHQFRSMISFSAVTLIPAIYMLIVHRLPSWVGPLLVSAVLMGFRAKFYKATKALFFMLMMVGPARYPSSPMFLLTPLVIALTSVQVLVQTQSDLLMGVHLALHAVGFYFYGMDCMTAVIRKMSTDDLIESMRTVMVCTFVGAAITMFCMKIFYAQFSSLLRKVNTLTESLSKMNNRLNDQNLKLQNNLEMKDVFIYTFSHELKNALNGLLGNLTLAYDIAKDDTRVLQFLASAKVCGEVLKNFIHNILDSGKLEKGNLEVSLERKDVMSLMQNVWSICGRIIQNKRLKGSLEIEKNVPKLLDLDEQRLIQIILNLVSNACKFTEKGHVCIRVSWQTISASSSREEVKGNQCTGTSQAKLEEDIDEVRETTPLGDIREFPDTLEARPSKKECHHLITEYQKKFIEGARFYELNLAKSHWSADEMLLSTLPEGSKGILKIQVMDSGCGMTLEDQAKLFKKFSQVSSTQDQRKVGTGLGLWICKELASRLEGDIKTRSVVGVGSVFDLTVRTRVSIIPVRPRNRQYPRVRRSINSVPAPLSCDQRGSNMRKILIADDDSFNIELLKNYLNKFGLNYICAYDGEEAVSLFKKHYKRICFVITDNFMPKKTGTEAALEIASFLEEERQPKIPIMCISGDLKVTVGEKGITSVIQKPINFDRLKEELMAVYPQLAPISTTT